MKVGDLVRLTEDIRSLGLFKGVLAILTEIDWDERDYPAGVGGSRGRGFFFFPDRQKVHERYRRDGSLGIMLLYDDFEVLTDNQDEDHK